MEPEIEPETALPPYMQEMIRKYDEYLQNQKNRSYEYGGLVSDNEDGEDGNLDWPWLKQHNVNEKCMLNGRITKGLADCATTLFDNKCCLKVDFKKHFVKKDTGVWGSIGKTLFQDIWQRAKASYRPVRFAIALPAHLHTGFDPISLRSRSEEEQYTITQQSVTSSVSFWRALGFRRIRCSEFFALAADPNHAANHMPKGADYDPPTIELATGPWPIHDALNYLGNTIIHIITPKKVKTLEWVLEKPWLKDLLLVRNHDLDTPKEKLLSILDFNRTVMESQGMVVGIFDDFKGFRPNSIDRIFKLRGNAAPTEGEQERAKYGCTCGECIAGFLSPRLALAVATQAGLDGDEMSMILDESHNLFLLCWPVKHLPPSKRSRLMEEPICRGFIRLFFLITNCHERKRLPTTTNIRAIMDSTNMDDLHAGSFLGANNGSMAHIFQSCSTGAIDEDRFIGNGQLNETYRDEIERLPECRNDREIKFAMKQHLRIESSDLDG
ncbi:MAG: hypothetical protein MMC33_003096 [Icmadophila ericetorum]|nr:hypothetical protein [Icmadophila ericetorum]